VKPQAEKRESPERDLVKRNSRLERARKMRLLMRLSGVVIYLFHLGKLQCMKKDGRPDLKEVFHAEKFRHNLCGKKR
jgi:hypothetical protein